MSLGTIVKPSLSEIFSLIFLENLLKKSTTQDKEGLNNSTTDEIPKKKIKNPVPI